jgi:PIN domain nuclease of toxin-antitoxin system
MKLLLDTHTFIWWDSEPAKLSPTALELCTDQANDLVLSITSVWEMQIKSQLGKIRFSVPVASIVPISNGKISCAYFRSN